MFDFTAAAAALAAFFATGPAPDVNYERPYSPKVYQWDFCKEPYYSCNGTSYTLTQEEIEAGVEPRDDK